MLFSMSSENNTSFFFERIIFQDETWGGRDFPLFWTAVAAIKTLNLVLKHFYFWKSRRPLLKILILFPLGFHSPVNSLPVHMLDERRSAFLLCLYGDSTKLVNFSLFPSLLSPKIQEVSKVFGKLSCPWSKYQFPKDSSYGKFQSLIYSFSEYWALLCV